VDKSRPRELTVGASALDCPDAFSPQILSTAPQGGTVAMTAEGLVTRPSRHPPAETMDRLSAAVARCGMTVIARVDHAGEAAKVGLDLRPTELLIFGNPRAGTPLMQAAQLIGIDLPLRALAWQDDAQATWISYVDPGWLTNRHGIARETAETVDKMRSVLEAVIDEAVA
jgi:uncharacterized protein (DUF302 family)